MSVSFISSPLYVTPSDNEAVYVFSSTQTAQVNFSFVIEVYVNAVLDSRHEVFPEVGTRAHFDIAPIAKRVTPVASVQQTTVVKDASNYCDMYIIVKERYGATPAYGASATSSSTKTFKARLTNELRQVWSANQYKVLALPGLMSFMTYNTNALYIKPDKDYFLTFINDVSENGMAVNFDLYNSFGASITSSDVAISIAFQIVQLNMRTSFLIAETPITQPLFDSAAYMEVYITQFGGDPLSEKKRIYFDREECNQTAHCVWLNRLGGFDCYNFQHNSIYSSAITSNDYEKQFGEWIGSSYVLNAQNSGEVDYLKSTRNRMQLISGYITGPVQNYLVTSMYNSPLCYLSESTFKRVKIESTAYELQNDLYEEEFTEIVELSFPNTDQSIVL